mmetsp:Transcript_6552/g.15751  ORF Transcript_6552/g.15751 Transcript_6552/m.15751 type:complete len:222 (+) Transcript_6552:871-1536(+)
MPRQNRSRRVRGATQAAAAAAGIRRRRGRPRARTSPVPRHWTRWSRRSSRRPSAPRGRSARRGRRGRRGRPARQRRLRAWMAGAMALQPPPPVMGRSMTSCKVFPGGGCPRAPAEPRTPRTHRAALCSGPVRHHERPTGGAEAGLAAASSIPMTRKRLAFRWLRPASSAARLLSSWWCSRILWSANWCSCLRISCSTTTLCTSRYFRHWMRSRMSSSLPLR